MIFVDWLSGSDLTAGNPTLVVVDPRADDVAVLLPLRLVYPQHAPPALEILRRVRIRNRRISIRVAARQPEPLARVIRRALRHARRARDVPALASYAERLELAAVRARDLHRSVRPAAVRRRIRSSRPLI
eukprot:31081-Pelagococcus_subviridis.AAC.10